MKPATMHFGGLFLVGAGVLMQVAGAAQAIPGPVGLYAGLTSQILGVVLHAVNTPNATTPPPK